MAAVEVRLVVCLKSFPPHLHPLDVLISPSHLNTVFPSETHAPTVLFTLKRPQVPEGPAVLLRVYTATEQQVSDCGELSTSSGSPVPLFISHLFLQHRGVLENERTATVRAVEPVSLQRVVLGARSRWSFHRAGEDEFHRRLLELCRPGHWLLARQGEPLPAPQTDDCDQEHHLLRDLLVLECSPVTQGRITADTSVVLTDYLESGNACGSFPLHRQLQLHVSDFALYADSLGDGRSLFDSRRLLGSGLSDVLQALECKLDIQVVDTDQWAEVRGPKGDFVDVDGCLFVSKQLLLRLGMFNQEWVRLWRPGGNDRTVTGEIYFKERLVSVLAVDPGLHSKLQPQSDVGFISATLWFNMTGGDAIPENRCTLRMKKYNTAPPEPCGSRSSCGAASPPRAQQLHIQPVTTPLDNSLGCWDNLLAEHFSTPRLVSTGDILTVPAKNHPDVLENNAEGINRSPVLFFRVQEVCSSSERGGGESYLADRTHTSLFMTGSTNCAVPCWPVHKAALVSTLTPSGLRKTVDVLSNIILPHFQDSGGCPLAACTVLLHGPAGSGKMTVVREISSRLHLHLLKVDCGSVSADTAAASEVKLSSVFQRTHALQPCILLLRNIQLLFRARGPGEDDARVQAALCHLLSAAPSSALVVATTCKARELSSAVMAAFVHQVALESPTEEQRFSMLVSLSRDLPLGRSVNLRRLSQLSAGFVLGDLKALLVEAGRAACRRLLPLCDAQQQEDVCSSGINIHNQDFISALEMLQDTQSKAIGAPEIPKVHWEDVGGLHDVKKEILDTVRLPLQCAHLLPLGLRRTGILLYGPPGTGKTLLAKTVATECSMTFLSVKGPELINMYVGQSEENIRQVFLRARSAAPCIVFFDELDSLAPSRGCSGDSGGVIDRVVSQLLAELDTLQLTSGVFVIGATNRPDLLDQSLLRPGRFDKLVYVGINKDPSSQLQVFQAILRKFHLDSAVNLDDLVNQCPAHMTGADVYALCSDAMTAAIKRKISLIAEGVEQEDSPLLLAAEDFSSALENFKPSVSEQELLRYTNLQTKLRAK